MMKANIGKAQALAERTKTSKFLFRGIEKKKNKKTHCFTLYFEILQSDFTPYMFLWFS